MLAKITRTDEADAILTTEHANSSYGQPVLLLDGGVYGPADLITVWMGAGEATEQTTLTAAEWISRRSVQPMSAPEPTGAGGEDGFGNVLDGPAYTPEQIAAINRDNLEAKSLATKFCAAGGREYPE